jgi:dolichyl-phosphate-mannose-protein mannosyltransferase
VSGLPRTLNRPILAFVAVTAIAAFLRFFHLAHPPDFVFDEVYYPKAGCVLIGGSDDVCRVDSSAEKYWREQKWDVGSWVHPPLGKWEIGLGIKAFGMD